MVSFDWDPIPAVEEAVGDTCTVTKTMEVPEVDAMTVSLRERVFDGVAEACETVGVDERDGVGVEEGGIEEAAELGDVTAEDGGEVDAGDPEVGGVVAGLVGGDEVG